MTRPARTFTNFLTPEEFTARFGPTEQDYEAVENFRAGQRLDHHRTHGNRLVLDVTGPAAAVEKAFHITCGPISIRPRRGDFFAPDTEPTVDAALPVADIQGLSDFARPHPKVQKNKPGAGPPKPALLRTARATYLATIFATPMCRG